MRPPLLVICITLLLALASFALALEGKYKLISETDAYGIDVPLPDGRFKLRVELEPGGDSNSTYRFYYRIGNSISATVVVEPDHSANFSGIMSTKMLPPKDIYQLERRLTAIMDAKDATVERTGRILVIASGVGLLSFKAKPKNNDHFQHGREKKMTKTQTKKGKKGRRKPLGRQDKKHGGTLL